MGSSRTEVVASLPSRPKVSVIVPVYDCKATLEVCLDSILAQTLDQIEIVVVNDGSPDTEQDIIDEYVRLHPEKIVSYAKENGGLSDARNYGAARSHGEFIGYVDSDDFIEPEMFQRLHDTATSNNCDIAIGKYIHHGLDGRETVQGKLNREEDEVFPGYEFLVTQRVMVVWNKLYRKTLIDRFPQPITWFEDVAWTPVVMSHTDRVCYIDDAYYHYVRREGSIASSHEDLRTLDGIASIRYALEHSAAEHRDAVELMAIRRLLFESNIRPAYADRYLRALNEMSQDLHENHYFLEDDSLRAETAAYLGDVPIVPKRVFWANFSDHDLTKHERRCVESWSESLIYGDGEIIELNENNCDLRANPLTAALQEEGHHELVGQYFLLDRVCRDGGVALDRRLLAHGFLAPLLMTGAFASYATPERLGALAFGAVPGHAFMAEVAHLFEQALTSGRVDPETLPEAFTAAATHVLAAQLHGKTEHLGNVTLHDVSTFAYRLNDTNVTELTYEPWPVGADEEDGTGRYSVEYVERLFDRVIELERRKTSTKTRPDRS